jgi:hypothetical protein
LWVWAASCAGDIVRGMLSPKVIEVRRGSAHREAVGTAWPVSTRGAELRLLSAVPGRFSAHEYAGRGAPSMRNPEHLARAA